MIVNYVDLESVIYKFRSKIPDVEVSDKLLMENAIEVLKEAKIYAALSKRWAGLEIVNHTLMLPEDYARNMNIYVYLPSVQMNNQNFPDTRVDRLAGFEGFKNLIGNYQTVVGIPEWKEILPARGNIDICYNNQCEMAYVNHRTYLRTNFHQGLAIVSYDSFKNDNDKYQLPDYEPLHMAILYYTLYWEYDKLCRTQPSRDNQLQRQNYYILYGKKLGECKNLNIPDDSERKEISTFHNKLRIHDDLFQGKFNA